jgi:hypothetical protein
MGMNPDCNADRRGFRRYNESVIRRRFLRLLTIPSAAFFSVRFALAENADSAKATARGKLTKSPDKKPVLETSDHKLLYLDGDEQTVKVLNDERLAGSDFEALGRNTSPDHFEIDPIHDRAMFVHKDGKRLMITYWCDVCYIRTYSPGPCWCCQRYTDLDLRESE